MGQGIKNDGLRGMDKKEFIHIRAFFHDIAFDILAKTQRDDINMILESLLEG